MQADAFWEDVRQRRTAPNRAFVYAVRSTGIYCRPGCPSRLPRRDNVGFYPDWRAAEADGFRPCKRCDPRGAGASASLVSAVITDACRTIDAAESPPPLATLAARAGYSPFHFHRLFKAQTGVTPRQYAAGQRAERVRQALARGADVTGAIYAAGYNAPSRFYAESRTILGMAPATARGGAAGERIGYAVAQTSIGTVLAAAAAQGLCAIDIGDAPEPLIAALHRRFPKADINASATLDGLLPRVLALADHGDASGLPLDLRGTAFQLRVWQALRAIPLGETTSYGEIASRIGAPTSSRAVAGACAANAIALAVPCHRVTRADGALAGYRWGVPRKRALLKREAALAKKGAPASV